MITRRRAAGGGLAALLLAALCYWWQALPQPLFRQPLSTLLLDSQGQLLGATLAADQQWRLPLAAELPERYQQPHQARQRPPTSFEDLLGDAIERAFGNGITKLTAECGAEPARQLAVWRTAVTFGVIGSAAAAVVLLLFGVQEPEPSARQAAVNSSAEISPEASPACTLATVNVSRSIAIGHSRFPVCLSTKISRFTLV